MRAVLIIFAAVAASTAAQAQTTSCGWEIGRWVCRGQRAAPLDIVGNAQTARQQGYDETQRMIEDQRVARAARDQQEQARAEAEATLGERGWMRGVTDAMQAGRCDEAKQMALNAARLDIADQVVRVCTSK